MSTGYTRDELVQLKYELERFSPPLPTALEKNEALQVATVTAAATELGVIFHLHFTDGGELSLWLNCVAAKSLAEAIDKNGKIWGWGEHITDPEIDTSVSHPARSDLAGATRVTATTTAFAHDGMVTNICAYIPGDGGAILSVYFPQHTAIQVLISIVEAAELTGWWTEDFEFIPRPI